LDARNTEAAQNDSGWANLTAAFNDYDSFTYFNATLVHEGWFMPHNARSLLYVELGGRPKKLNGCHVFVADMEAIASLCCEMNPNDTSRPSRDVEWIRSQYKEIRSKITLVRERIKRSGNQENENTFDEWVKFCEGNDVTAYARSVLTEDIMDQFGKALPNDNQSDTGATKQALTAEEHARKMQLQKLRRAKNNKSSVPTAASPMTTSSEGRSLSEVLAFANTSNQSNIQMQALQALLKDGNAEARAMAQARLLEFSGLSTSKRSQDEVLVSTTIPRPEQRQTAAISAVDDRDMIQTWLLHDDEPRAIGTSNSSFQTPVGRPLKAAKTGSCCCGCGFLHIGTGFICEETGSSVNASCQQFANPSLCKGCFIKFSNYKKEKYMRLYGSNSADAELQELLDAIV
jgi:hypothetical protein